MRESLTVWVWKRHRTRHSCLCVALQAPMSSLRSSHRSCTKKFGASKDSAYHLKVLFYATLSVYLCSKPSNFLWLTCERRTFAPTTQRWKISAKERAPNSPCSRESNWPNCWHKPRATDVVPWFTSQVCMFRLRVWRQAMDCLSLSRLIQGR